jgi:RNA polymerase sigma-70 factor (ECF subfamily)
LQRLSERLASGDESAFAELYDACVDRLFAYAKSRSGSHELAADVLQSSFLRLVKSRRRLRKVESPVAYLFQIARNELARQVNRRADRNSQPLESAGSVPDFRWRDGVDDADTACAVLGRLESAAREIVELKIYGGLTFEEIAATTGQPMGTVASRYRRALESLRDWLEKQYR